MWSPLLPHAYIFIHSPFPTTLVFGWNLKFLVMHLMWLLLPPLRIQEVVQWVKRKIKGKGSPLQERRNITLLIFAGSVLLMDIVLIWCQHLLCFLWWNHLTWWIRRLHINRISSPTIFARWWFSICMHSLRTKARRCLNSLREGISIKELKKLSDRTWDSTRPLGK